VNGVLRLSRCLCMAGHSQFPSHTLERPHTQARETDFRVKKGLSNRRCLSVHSSQRAAASGGWRSGFTRAEDYVRGRAANLGLAGILTRYRSGVPCRTSGRKYRVIVGSQVLGRWELGEPCTRRDIDDIRK
jgi:hypothetical protein